MTSQDGLITDVRHPRTIEEAIIDCQDAIAHRPAVAVIPTNELMLEMLTLLAKIKHS